jgi:hypothetical protein
VAGVVVTVVADGPVVVVVVLLAVVVGSSWVVVVDELVVDAPAFGSSASGLLHPVAASTATEVAANINPVRRRREVDDPMGPPLVGRTLPTKWDTAAVTDRRQELLDRFERATELPLLILAVLMVPLLAIPLLLHLDGATEAAFVAADWFVWAVFAVEYMVRLSLSTKRWRFIRREWPDLLIIVLPFLRPLRIVRSARALRLLRLGRLVAFLGVAGQETRRLLVRHQLHYALLITVGVLVAAPPSFSP